MPTSGRDPGPNFWRAELDGDALLKLAMAQRGELFIGVVLSPGEVERLIRNVEVVLPNVTMPLVGRRLRRRS